MHRDAADLVKPHLCLVQGFIDDGKQALQVRAGGHFGHDPAETRVQIGL